MALDTHFEQLNSCKLTFAFSTLCSLDHTFTMTCYFQSQAVIFFRFYPAVINVTWLQSKWEAIINQSLRNNITPYWVYHKILQSRSKSSSQLKSYNLSVLRPQITQSSDLFKKRTNHFDSYLLILLRQTIISSLTKYDSI